MTLPLGTTVIKRIKEAEQYFLFQHKYTPDTLRISQSMFRDLDCEWFATTCTILVMPPDAPDLESHYYWFERKYEYPPWENPSSLLPRPIIGQVHSLYTTPETYPTLAKEIALLLV